LNYWIQNLAPYGSPEDIGVIQLAWLGDSVWELHQRLKYVHFPLKSKELHLSVVNEVKAKSQSKSLGQIEHLLNENEFYSLFEKKISKLIFTNLPFLTVEQLKINEIEKNINKEINFTIFDSSTKIKDDQKEKFQYEDGFN